MTNSSHLLRKNTNIGRVFVVAIFRGHAKPHLPLTPLLSCLIQHDGCCTSPLMYIITQKQEYIRAGFSHAAMPLSIVIEVKLLSYI
jgi:hypothetical protein